MDKEIENLTFEIEDVERYKDVVEDHNFLLLDEFIIYLLKIKHRRSHYSINRKELKEWTMK
jgi:hypothetical protein